MARRSAPVPRMVDLEALLLRDYELHERRSVGRARAALAHLRRYFRDVDPARTYDLTARYIIRRRASGAAPATIRYEISILGRALTLAARAGGFDGRPFLARPQVRNARSGFLEPGPFRLLLARLPQPIRDAAKWAYVTGWRRSEIFGLAWDHVDLVAGLARLDAGTTKNGEGRVFPFGLHPKLRRMMERRAMERRGVYVFGRESGARVVTFDRPWKRACLEAQVGSILFHDLRRSAVRNMIRAGVDEQVAMRLSGHLTRDTFRRYDITSESDLERAVARIARAPMKRGRRDEEEEPGGGGARAEALEGRQGRRAVEDHDRSGEEALGQGEEGEKDPLTY